MNTKIQKILAILVTFSALQWGSGALQAAELPPMTVKAVDTVAGYSSAFKTSRGLPEEEVFFEVTTPTGSIVEIPAKTNPVGAAEGEIYGHNTRKAGEYAVRVCYRNCAEERAPLTTFQVYADTVSASDSVITNQSGSVEADGKEEAFLKIQLRDRHLNPVAGHTLTIVSSRSEDRIGTPLSPQGTNKNGEQVFPVSSSVAGVSYITIIDTSSGITLQERAQIIFFESEETLERGGNFLQANIFGDPQGNNDLVPSGPIAEFELEFTDGQGNQNTALVGSDQNIFTVTAVDSSGNTVSDYTGTILISTPDDESAMLPSNGQYTFRPQDFGTFTFSLAFRFSRIGKQRIQVFDYDPETGRIAQQIRGELTIEVVSTQVNCPSGNCTPQQNPSSVLTIKTPEEGNVYATNTIPLSGKGAANTDISVFIDDIAIQEVALDQDGIFLASLPNISDGVHELYVQEIGANGALSETISFEVDTLPPQLEQISVFPEKTKYVIGDSFTVTLMSEAKLQKATIRFDGNTYTLQENMQRSGTYETSLAIPAAPGEQSLDVHLVDGVGNESTLLSQVKIHIQDPAPIAPEAPKNIQVVPQEESVQLSWDAVSHKETIAMYIISQGDEFQKEVVQSVPGTQTSVIISDLSSEKEYQFSLQALDTKGQKSSASKIVSVMPLEKEEEPVVSMPQKYEVQTQAGAAQVFVSWQPSLLATEYVVKYGTAPGKYYEQVKVSAVQNAVQIADLIAGVPYYFTVVPYKNGLPTEEQYSVAAATPLQETLHSAPSSIKDVPHNSTSGPAEVLVFMGMSFLLVSFLFVGKSLFVHKS